MGWLKKINAIFLAIVLVAPVTCITIAAMNDVSNISSLTITTPEEEQEDKDAEEEVETDNVKTFLPLPINSTGILICLNFSFHTKGIKLQNRSGDIFSPPPELT